MKLLQVKIIIPLFLVISFFCYNCLAEDMNSDLKAFYGLVNRVAPTYGNLIKGEILPENGNDIFEIESIAGKTIIRGNNANSMAVGLNYYLKNYCLTNISWYVDNKIVIPINMPIIDKKVRRTARCENRFFLNYCTFGYTMPWWQWRDWEHFIDWMALHGITMPLAITGQEAVWYRVWKHFGLTDKQIRTYFTGPAHLPWHRMANLDRWQGSLPQSWLDNQLKLQKKIVKRERELNMTPVLPAFAGHVPADLKKIYPKAEIKRLGRWGGFPDKYRSSFLSPLDPLFTKIQKEFLTEQTRLFGTNNIYGTDPFNEVKPPSWEPNYLAKVGEVIYNSMAEVDPKAKWLQMTWVFYFDRKHWTNKRIKAMLRAVPQDKMILLDYYCEKQEVWKMTDKFFHQPYIWCYLGNFGGNTMLAGNLKTIEERIENTFKNGGEKMCGLGSTLEALDCNQIMYEYVFEKIWSNGLTDVDKWIQNYAASRCGGKDPNYLEAWKILLNKVYTKTASLGQATLTNSRPTLTGQGNWTTKPQIHYKNSDLLKVWVLMLNSSHKNRDSYKYDLVNIGRQVLGNYFKVLRDEFATAYLLNDYKTAKKVGNRMIELLDDMERLLATRTDFLLGKWLEGAKKLARNNEEIKYYENNARVILTTWGRKGQSLNEYANRSWSGLLDSYYAERWKRFIGEVIQAIHNKKSFDSEKFKKEIVDFEWEWTKRDECYSSKKVGDTIAIATELCKKYQTRINNFVKVENLKIGEWNRKNCPAHFKLRKINLRKYITGKEKQIVVVFKYTHGKNAAIIKDVELCANGKVISTDVHTGSTGFKHKNNVFKLLINKYNKSMKYGLRFKIKGDKGTNSNGVIYVLQKVGC